MSIDITQEKRNTIGKLMSMKIKLSEIQNEFKIDLNELVNKVDQALSNIENEVFSIAFFGAFSDGKSTILSILIDNLKIDISPTPTTNKVQAYTFSDYQIVDTPGLFSDEFIHDELTRQYISESNIVIYTVDSVNPLKESHSSIIKWILSDLKKYDSTIFVVNKMDLVADLEDDSDFYKNAEIKKTVVAETIQDVTGIENNLKIVCIAADPFERGLEYWKSNEDDYRKLSRIEILETMISEFKTCYKNELVVKAGISIIRDASLNVLAELDIIRTDLVAHIDILKNQTDECYNKIKNLENSINRSYVNIKEEFISLRGEILVEIDSASNKVELANTIQKNIGMDGYILQENIDLIIKTHTDSLLSEGKDMILSLEKSLDYHSKIQRAIADRLSKAGISIIKGMLSAPTRKIADTVIKIRNILKVPIKFKPWGALKVAKFLKALPAIMEALQLFIGVMSKLMLDKKRHEIKNEIENTFKGLLSKLNEDQYVNTYFPFVADTKEILKSLEESKVGMQEVVSNIEKIKIELTLEHLNGF